MSPPPPPPQEKQPVGLSSAKLPIVQVLRSIVAELPKPNARGELAWKKSVATGNAANIELLKPENRVTEAEHRKLLKEKMPSFPFISVLNPEIRAKKILQSNKGNLVPEVVEQAAAQFRVPEGQRILFIGPEYFCRDALLKDPKFQVKDGDGTVTGIMPSCPWCRSNSGVSFRTFECQNVQSSPRCGVHTDSTRYPLLGARYWCKSKGCVGEVPLGEVEENGNVRMEDKDGEMKVHKSGQHKGDPMIWVRTWHEDQNHSFVIWNKGCFEQFPVDVRKIFSRFLFGLAHDFEGAEPNLLPTPELALELLDTSNSFGSLKRRLQTHYQVQREHAKQSYYEFVKNRGQYYAKTSTFFRPRSEQPEVTPVVQWPDFDEVAFKYEMGPPSVHALENVFWLSFEMVQPYLERDLMSRTPGRFVRWDGTYGAAKKMMNVDELDSVDTLMLITGEYGDIVSYAFAHDENPSNWQILHYFLMKRCKAKGNLELHKVRYGYDDLGSMNYSDPAKHWFATIWPAAERGPLKDPLHAVMLIGRSTYAHKHPMNDWFAKELTACLMEYEKTSVNSAAAQLQVECPNTSADVALHTVLSQPSWKKKLYNKTLSRTQQLRRVRSFWEKATREDEKLMEEGHPRFLRLESPTSRSTGCEIAQLIYHIERGDYQDPLPPREMSFVRRTACAVNVEQSKKMKPGLEILGRLRGTNTVESTNKQINYSVQNATRLRKKLCDAKVQLRIHRHNLSKDHEFGRKTGRTAKDVFWLLQESNDLLASEIEYLNTQPSINYPPHRYDSEPLGLEFENYKKYIAKVEIDYLNKVQAGKRPARAPAFSLSNPGGRTPAPVVTPGTTPPPDVAIPAPGDPSQDSTAMTSDSEAVTPDLPLPPPDPEAVTPDLPPPSPDPEAVTQELDPGVNRDDALTPPDDDFESFLDNFDVDTFINQNQSPPASPRKASTKKASPRKASPPKERLPTTPPRTKRPSPKSTPSPSKKKRYQSGGATVYNRKEGNRSLMSPTRMTVQQPLNVGQNERMARLLTHITSSGTPKQITTASGTAKAVMDAWNYEEYSCNLNGEMPMGVLPIGVAKSVVKGMSNTMVKARAEGVVDMQLLTPLEIQDPSFERKAPAAAPKKKPGPKKQDIGPVPQIKDLSDATIRNLSSRKLKFYIRHYNSVYKTIKPALIPSGKKVGLENSLIDFVKRITASTASTDMEWL